MFVQKYFKYPQLILKTEKTDLWHLFDLQFKMPKADIFCNIYLDDENWTGTLNNYMYAQIWLKMFNKSFEETKNMAKKVKQEISISMQTNCIHLNAWGYNDTIGVLMLKALEDMCVYVPKNRQRFENVRSEMQ